MQNENERSEINVKFNVHQITRNTFTQIHTFQLKRKEEKKIKETQISFHREKGKFRSLSFFFLKHFRL